MNTPEEHVSAELGRLIASVLAGAGEGIACLRDRGADVALRDCSIEVMVDDQAAPSAHLRIRFEPGAEGTGLRDD